MDEDFKLFDDKQTATLDAVDKKEDDAADDADTSSTDASVSEDTDKKSDDKADEEVADDKSDASAGEDTSEADSTKSDEDQVSQADTSSDQDKKDDAVADVDDKKEQFATKEDIRAALAEQAATAEAQQTTRKALRNELRSELFPDGIDVDLKIKDSDNGIIVGPSQIAGKLINPKTQELFTYEEAKDYWDNAQKQIDKAIEDREQLIDKYAENNQSFFEGSQIVESKYGTFLKANPEIAKQLLDNYLKTAKVTKTGYITEMPLNVVAYYDTAMKPMQSVAKQLELQKQGEDERKAAEAKKTNQSDRADLPVNNNNTPAAKNDDLTNAFGRYFEGK
jgi:hypothetical protein